MRNPRFFSILMLCVALTFQAIPVNAATKAGAKCTKVGSKSVAGNKTFTCIKSGKKLVWNKGIGSEFKDGLYEENFDGYFEDDASLFLKKPESSSTVQKIDFKGGCSGKCEFTKQWSGYFIPNETGYWKFSVISDDASYIWLGKDALSQGIPPNSILNLAGIHAPLEANASVYLLKYHAYPIRVVYGNSINFAQMTLYPIAPSGKYHTNLALVTKHALVDKSTPVGINPKFKSINFSTEVSTESFPVVLDNIGKVPKPELTTSEAFDQDSLCQLQQNYEYYWRTGFGFPRSIHRLKNYGEVRGIMIFVEFNDIKGSDDPVVEGRKFSDNFIKFYEEMSYGKLQFKVEIYPRYISIDADSGKYGMQEHSKGDAGAYLKDGIMASDPLVDFSSYDFVAFIPPSGIKKIVYGPAFPFPPDNRLATTNEKVIYNATVSGSDWRDSPNKWIWLSHEVGHLLGMEHQYKVNSENRIPIWDLMNYMSPDAPGLFAWHRFLQGWLSESQVYCSDLPLYNDKKVVVDLSALGKLDQNLKTVMIKINESELIVIETRVRIGFDIGYKFGDYSGVLAYKVDVNKKTNEGAISLLKTVDDFSAPAIIGTLTPNQFIESNGLRITNLGSSLNGYYVEVKKI